jgi:hypothetical protein
MSKRIATVQAVQARFEREKGLLEYLFKRLKLDVSSMTNPNAGAGETGVDVRVHLVGGLTIGVQVTEIDPHPKPGKARAQERRVIRSNPDVTYGGWGQNDLKVLLDSLFRTVERKADIAAQHSAREEEKTWLLICGGIPDAPVSTFVMSPWLSAVDMNSSTHDILQKSKFDCCFFFPIIAVEQAFYRWQRNRGWKKSVRLDEAHQRPNEAYVKNLLLAANANDWAAVDDLCDEECKKVLSELRGE